MKIAISPRKMASAQIAFLVIYQPHCDETDETLMSFTVTSAASANASLQLGADLRRLVVDLHLDDRAAVGRALLDRGARMPSIPLSSRIASASSTEKFSAGTSQATPPVKSSPRLSPLTLSDTTLITIIASDSPKPPPAPAPEVDRRLAEDEASPPRRRDPARRDGRLLGFDAVGVDAHDGFTPSPNVSRRSSRPLLARRATAGRVKQKNTIRSHTVVMPR